MIKNCKVFGWGALLDINEREKQLLRPVNYFWEDSVGLQRYTAPAGFQFDGASKWFAWRLLGYPWGQAAKAACLHDSCFQERFKLSGGNRVTFAYAADLYIAFLEATGVGLAQRRVEYVGVHSEVCWNVWKANDARFLDG